MAPVFDSGNNQQQWTFSIELICIILTVVFCATGFLIILLCCGKKKFAETNADGTPPLIESKEPGASLQANQNEPQNKQASVSGGDHNLGKESKLSTFHHAQKCGYQTKGQSVQAKTSLQQNKAPKAIGQSTKTPVICGAGKLAQLAKAAAAQEAKNVGAKKAPPKATAAVKTGGDPKGANSWPSLNEDHTYYKVPLNMEM